MPPMHILSLGAGVQSSTLALMAACGEIAPMPDMAIFADTQAEPDAVYRWLEYLTPLLPFSVYVVAAGDLRESALQAHISKRGIVYHRTAIPYFTRSLVGGEVGRIGRRTCTRDFKIKPIIKQVREIVGTKAMRKWRLTHKVNLAAWREYQGYLKASRKAARLHQAGPPVVRFPQREWDGMQADPLVAQWIGISLDEIQRAKPSRDPWIRNEWPLIERRMTRRKCVDWMRSHGYPDPPRSACYFCPFRSNAEWRRLRDTDPAAWQAAIEFDRQSREVRRGTSMKSDVFVHRSAVPLDQADIGEKQDGQGSLFSDWDEECEGMCGT